MDPIATNGAGADYWQRLLHRWFVQYNPIYLVSAMLVLGGMITAARGLAHEGSLYGPLGIAIIAEVYALALIGGAALLTRIRQKRPAVLLALITIAYQSDLTLHTETCAFLGGIGIAASVAWLGLFVAKLRALAWALQVRPSRRAIATATFGAAGLAFAPHVLGTLDARTAGGALAVFVFALVTLCPRAPEDAVTTLVPLGEWGHTVLRRMVRAAWIIWGVLLGLHILFWSSQREIQLAAILPALVLLAARGLRRERSFWAAVLASIAVVALFAPAGLAGTALLVALAIVQRAVSVSNPVASSERVRLFSGGLFAMHLSVWTMGWHGGALPEHILLLDGALVASVLLMAWRLRARAALFPLAALCTHGAVATGLVPPPRTLFQYGMTAVALGFVLLVGSLATSYRLRRFGADEPSPPP